MIDSQENHHKQELRTKYESTRLRIYTGEYRHTTTRGAQPKLSFERGLSLNIKITCKFLTGLTCNNNNRPIMYTRVSNF